MQVTEKIESFPTEQATRPSLQCRHRADRSAAGSFWRWLSDLAVWKVSESIHEGSESEEDRGDENKIGLIIN